MKVLALAVCVVLGGCVQESKPPAQSALMPPDRTSGLPVDAARGASPADEAKLRKEYETAKSRYAEAPETKAAYVAKLVEYADATMYGSGAPREKYGKALALYNDALKLDADNAQAKKNRDMILEIYKSMGRTPPVAK